MYCDWSVLCHQVTISPSVQCAVTGLFPCHQVTISPSVRCTVTGLFPCHQVTISPSVRCAVTGLFLCHQVTISPSVRCTVLRLVELGWLHSRVRMFCRSVTARPDAGLLAQSLASVLREQLEQFYRLIALMEAQVRVADGGPRRLGRPGWGWGGGVGVGSWDVCVGC